MTATKARIIKDDVARNSVLMIASGVISALFNYLYQVFMGRLLTPEEYGTVVSLLSVLVIISVFSSTVDTTVTSFISRESASRKLGNVAYLWKYFLIRTFIIGLLIFAFFSLLAPFISQFLNIYNSWYAVILFSSIIFTFSAFTNFGTLRGMQRFVSLGINSALWAFLKFSLGLGLVYLGFRVSGALASFMLAYIVVFFVSLYFMRDIVQARQEKTAVHGLQSFAILSLFSLLAFALLTNSDVILAKHYLSPADAGRYSAISTLGKLAMFIPAGVAIVMFPKIAQLSEAKESHRSVLYKAFALTGIIAGGIVVFYRLFPDFIAKVLFLGNYPDIAPFLAQYSLAMGFFAITNLLMFYLLSLRLTGVAFPLIAAAVLQLCLIILFHSSINQIVNMLLFSGVASLLFICLYYFYLRMRKCLL